MPLSWPRRIVSSADRRNWAFQWWNICFLELSKRHRVSAKLSLSCKSLLSHSTFWSGFSFVSLERNRHALSATGTAGADGEPVSPRAMGKCILFQKRMNFRNKYQVQDTSPHDVHSVPETCTASANYNCSGSVHIFMTNGSRSENNLKILSSHAMKWEENLFC